MRLIDADALYADLKESAKLAREWKKETQDEEIKIRAAQSFGTFCECALRVRNAQTVEPEQRNGRWAKSASGELYCPYCSYIPQWDDDKYCANCGARIDGGADK